MLGKGEKEESDFEIESWLYCIRLIHRKHKIMRKDTLVDNMVSLELEGIIERRTSK